MSKGPQVQGDLHAGLDVSVVERIRIPTRDVIREVRIGSLTVGKKKTGFIRLGSFNELRINDLDLVVTREFFAPSDRSSESGASLGRGAVAPEQSTREGNILPQHRSREHRPPQTRRQIQTQGEDARIRILSELKARVSEYAGGAYPSSESISSFSIRDVRILLDDNTGNDTVIIAAKRATVEKDCIRFGPRGGVAMQTAWGNASITCKEARITFTSCAATRMQAACVRCEDDTVNYAQLELPLRALVSRQAWVSHFQNAHGSE